MYMFSVYTKSSKLILAVCLVPAVIGAFTCSIAGSLNLDELAIEQEPGVYISRIEHQIDILAESIKLTGKPKLGSGSLQRAGALRLFMPYTMHNTAHVLSASTLVTNNKIHFLANKNSILLKLRI